MSESFVRCTRSDSEGIECEKSALETKIEALTRQNAALQEALYEATVLFEMDSECCKVGTDEWTWLQQARAALEAK